MMSLSILKNDVLGVVAGAVIGLLLQSVAVTLFLGVPFEQLVTIWGRYGVAILLVALFCIFYKVMLPKKALIASLLCGTLIPSLLAKLAFTYGVHWDLLLAFNLLFSIVALLVYRQIARHE
ncbi:MAG: hypothetical protein ABJM86_07170 [Hyphomicrobiales bacterium]